MLIISAVATSRLDANASHTIKTINITAVSEIKEPIEEIAFQVV